jgi:hypothetical protein
MVAESWLRITRQQYAIAAMASAISSLLPIRAFALPFVGA